MTPFEQGVVDGAFAARVQRGKGRMYDLQATLRGRNDWASQHGYPTNSEEYITYYAGFEQGYDREFGVAKTATDNQPD